MTKITFTSCFKCLKYSMFVFCLIAWVLGLITFIVGIVARVNGSFGILDAHIPAVHAGANLLIAVGFFIMIMGFLGCCGAIRESQCLLFLFFAFVFFCFTLLMAAGLWAVAWSSKVNHYMYRYLEEQVIRYRETEPENESTKLMDFIQKKFGCCGVTSAADYGTRSPPKSCTVTKSIQSYSRGCHEVLVEACRSNLSVICGVGISFALILGAETSTTTTSIIKSSQVLTNSCLHRILNVHWSDIISNSLLWERTNQVPAEEGIKKRLWQWIGHTLQKSSN